MAQTGPIRILIVDDHPVVRAGLASMLGTRAELEVIGAAPSGEDGLRMVQEHRPDVLLLDLRMHGKSGVDVLLPLKAAGASVRVILVTNYETDEDMDRAVQAGNQGYLLKDASLREMVEAIRAVHAGQHYIPRHIASRLAERMVRTDLTARKMEILKLLAKDRQTSRSGMRSGSAITWCETTFSQASKSSRVSDRTEAATIAIQRGLTTVDC